MLTLHAPHVDKLSSELSSDELSVSSQEEEYLKVLGNITFFV